MQQLTFGTQFELTFKVRLSEKEKVKSMIEENGYKHIIMVRIPFDAWYEFRVKCCIKTAYTLSKLLKKYNTYD